ncbi:hypothetical protein CER19_07655 [Pseudomonas sp. GL93]|nr:hypothetical protein CER19_07655 [Pseudomonas sp. GL93]
MCGRWLAVTDAATDTPPSVGASLLAKNVNDNACCLNRRGACGFFASKLAPTEGGQGLPLPGFTTRFVR